MNFIKLALLINDTWDAVERSKVGQIYLRDAQGKIMQGQEGSPFCNGAAMQTFQACLQAQIMKGNYES